MPEIVRVCFVHWDQLFLVEHSPWIFGSKKSSSAQSEPLGICCSITRAPSRLTSHRWHLNLSATAVAVHGYDSIIHICCKKSFCSGLSLATHTHTQRRNESGWFSGKSVTQYYVFSSIYLKLSQRRLIITVSWKRREKALMIPSFKVWLLKQSHKLPVGLLGHKRDESS